MGLMDGSIYPKIAALVILISMLLHLISYGSPNWAKTDPHVSKRREHMGLWKYCTYPQGASGERCDDFINIITGDWHKATQAFMTVGMFGLMACCGLIIVYALAAKDTPTLGIGVVVVIGVTGVLLLIGVTVFAGKYNDYFENKDMGAGPLQGILDWAFGVACASTAGVFISMTLVVIDLIQGMRDDMPY